jgi:hypothetical protein
LFIDFIDNAHWGGWACLTKSHFSRSFPVSDEVAFIAGIDILLDGGFVNLPG